MAEVGVYYVSMGGRVSHASVSVLEGLIAAGARSWWNAPGKGRLWLRRLDNHNPFAVNS